MFKTRYYVVPDNWAGYEIRVKKWWLPFSYQWDGVNTFMTLESAKSRIDMISKGRILYEKKI